MHCKEDIKELAHNSIKPKGCNISSV
jgi:hypothetical protein